MEFLYSALLGVFLGLLFDVFRVARVYLGRKKSINALLDVLFWISATVSLMVFILTVSEGKMRWYVLFGVFSGTFVYMSALGEIVYKVLLNLVRAAKKALRLMTYPINLFLSFVLKNTKKLSRSVEKKVREKIREKRKKKRRAENGKKEEKNRKRNIR